MTPTELKTTLTADAERLASLVNRLRQELAQAETMLIKTQGALEALAMLDRADDGAARNAEKVEV